VFETSFEKRRLRVLNSLLRTLDRLSVSVSIDGPEARTLVANVGDFSVGFTIDGVFVKTASAQPKGVSGPMRCQLMALCGGDQPIEAWTDVEGQPLETRLGDIAVAIVVHGERVCRSSAQHHREWVIKRKAEIVAEERRKEAERRRLERERLEQLEKARVGRLLAQAKSLREAEEIRAYVSAVRLVASDDGVRVDAGELRAARATETARLRSLIADATAASAGSGIEAGGAFTIGRPAGRRPLLALVAPVRADRAVVPDGAPATAMIVITDPESTKVADEDTLRTLFQLTASEAALARLLAEGATLNDAASLLKVSTETVRKRIKAVFDTTGTHCRLPESHAGSVEKD